VFVVAAMFMGASVTGFVFLMVCEVCRNEKEGDEAEDLPNTMYPSPLHWPFFVSMVRV